MTTTLSTLLDRVEKGEGADREIDADVMAACFPEWAAREPHLLGAHCAGDEPVYFHAPDWLRKQPVPRLTSSIDAAMDLVEKVLPGYDHGYNTSDGIAFGTVWRAGYLDDTVMRGEARTPARAIVAALLRAKIAQEEGA